MPVEYRQHVTAQQQIRLDVEINGTDDPKGRHMPLVIDAKSPASRA
jgi:hypothetical protein